MPGINGNSPATVDAYRYTFMRFLEFMEHSKGISASKIKISDLSYSNVTDFYNWLESEHHNSVQTRNLRQAGINSFVRFLMYEYPDYLNEYQKILSIPSKKSQSKEISYVKTEGMEALLSQVNRQDRNGERDYVILSLMYTTGIRVSELINIRVGDVMLQEPATLLVHGKGGKGRYVPIVKQIVPIVKDYLAANGLDQPGKKGEYLFLNHMGKPFTRQGINYLVSKYRDAANRENPESIPEDFSPHKIRHSTAMNLLEADVDLIYIRDLLGHTSVKTTEVYARTDSKKKREVIEAASKEIVAPESAQWDGNEDLKEWLRNFNRGVNVSK